MSTLTGEPRTFDASQAHARGVLNRDTPKQAQHKEAFPLQPTRLPMYIEEQQGLTWVDVRVAGRKTVVGGFRAAWFTDPNGNILHINNM